MHMVRWRHRLQALESETGTFRRCERKADMDMGHEIFFVHAPRALCGGCTRSVAMDGDIRNALCSNSQLSALLMYALFLFLWLSCRATGGICQAQRDVDLSEEEDIGTALMAGEEHAPATPIRPLPIQLGSATPRAHKGSL